MSWEFKSPHPHRNTPIAKPRSLTFGPTAADGPELITSRRNPLVQRLRGLHESRGRRDQGLLLLEGTHLLQEVLRLGLTPVHLLATEAWTLGHGGLIERLPPGCRPQPVGAEVLDAVATTRHPDGVVLTLPLPPGPQAAAPAAGSDGLVLALDTIQDPGNLGTLMRTALAAGVEALWLADGADPHQPKVLRASAGAALALPLWRTSRSGLAEQLERSLAAGVQLVATQPPHSGAVPYWNLDWCRPTVLLLGSEGAGLAPELLALASHRVTIPHDPAVESLNVAVAAAPLLLERQRQQRCR
ncbi:RNA methyltransferase [Cyanobium sp. ATX 6A2]|nr:RNA methyltransferase [Cyanobium sp. ATX 6A2]